MITKAPSCPTCHNDLTLQREGDFNPWVCSADHGLAATMSETYEVAQEDELHELWRQAKEAPTGAHGCPMCERPMAVVELGYDADEHPEGHEEDGPHLGTVHLDMCTACQVIWFDAGELPLLPADLPDPEPTEVEQVQIDQIAQQFADDVDAVRRRREAKRLTERMYRLMRGLSAPEREWAKERMATSNPD